MTVILRRLLELIPTLIGVSLLTFFLMRMAPGDPVKLILGPQATPEAIEAERKKLGFDQPLMIQYFRYMKGVVQGDLGNSITTKRPVTEEIFSRLPATFELAVVSMVFAILTGIFVGVFSSVYPRSAIDNVSRIAVFVFLAMPAFWLGLELIIIFARNLEWFPPGDRGKPWTPSMLGHLVLPAITLGVGTGAFLSRILRSSMLQVLNMDYIRTARAKGLDGKRVLFKHALKNAMIPFVTIAGLSTGSLLGGAVIVETVFNWPGVGKLLVDSIRERDFPITMGAVLILAVIFVAVNLIVDMLYVVLDPRIRLDGGKS
jgi:ABC-type dipeptide/oligopeptide/nickel transport system permease component